VPKKTGKNIFRYLPFVVMLGAAAWFLSSGREISVQDVLSYTPKAPARAALFLIAMYGLKSLSVFFPLAVLFAAGGFLFPWPVACLVNFAGLALATSIPYWIGKRTGIQAVEQLMRRYPKLARVGVFRRGNDFYSVFIIRVLGILSCDIVSMYLGAMNVSYPQYLAGGLLGFAPQVMAVTLLGESVTKPGSPQFFISLGMTISTSLIVIFFYALHYKRKKS